MRKRSWWSLAVAAPILVSAGCVPSVMAPTVAVTPGPGKLPADFALDQTACSAQANQQMAPVVQAANNQLIGNALLGVTPDQTVRSAQSTQTTLQQQYDAAYAQCMYAKGDNVPGLSPVAAEPQPEAEAAPAEHHYKHYARKKPATKATSANFVQPVPSASSSSGSFVEPAPAAAAASGGFAVPPPAAH